MFRPIQIVSVDNVCMRYCKIHSVSFVSRPPIYVCKCVYCVFYVSAHVLERYLLLLLSSKAGAPRTEHYQHVRALSADAVVTVL